MPSISSPNCSDCCLCRSAGVASDIAVVSALLIWLGRSTLERLNEIGNNIVDMLGSNGDTDEILQDC